MMDDAEISRLVVAYRAEQRTPEVLWFYRACTAIKPRVIVEIGIKVGGNLKILSTHLDEEGLIVGIDPWVSPDEIASAWKMDDARCVVRHIRKSSHAPDAVDDLRTLLAGRLIDVLFIDGDHSTEGMLQDYSDYSPFVRSGGVIAVHDIYYLKEVAEAWARIPASAGVRYESTRQPRNIGIGYVVKP